MYISHTVYVSIGIETSESTNEQAVIFDALAMFWFWVNEVIQESSSPQGKPASATYMSVVSKEKSAIRQIPKVNMGKSRSLNTETKRTSNWNLNPDAGNDEKYIPIINADKIGTTSDMYETVFAKGKIKPNFKKYIISPTISIKKGSVMMLFISDLFLNKVFHESMLKRRWFTKRNIAE